MKMQPPFDNEIDNIVNETIEVAKTGYDPDSEILNQPLLEKMKQGDYEAFRQVYMHTAGPLTDFLALLLHSREDAKDTTQELFADLWVNISKIDTRKNFKGYLYTIAKRAAYKRMERRRLDDKYYNYKITETPDFSVSPDEVVMTAELALMINIYINNMPAQRKRVFEMSRDEGMSDQQIADKLNISVATVRSHKQAAMKGIKDVISLCILLFFV